MMMNKIILMLTWENARYCDEHDNHDKDMLCISASKFFVNYSYKNVKNYSLCLPVRRSMWRSGRRGGWWECRSSRSGGSPPARVLRPSDRHGRPAAHRVRHARHAQPWRGTCRTRRSCIKRLSYNSRLVDSCFHPLSRHLKIMKSKIA